MPCYHPMPAVRMVDGSVKFVSRNKRGVEGDLCLPCGQCVGCRLERSRQWAMRCVHESSLHEANAFITLTYDDSSLPPGGSLVYADFQKFMKRLRKRTRVKISFYVGGEYGEELMRPHFHACLFGYDFPDKEYFKKSASGEKLYTSKLLESLWPFGLSSVGSVSFESAAYIARYCMKKVNGDLAKAHYEVITEDGEIIDRLPEFNHMSLKPAIGKRWLEKFQTDVFPRDYVVMNGVKTKPPKYYDRLFKEENPGVFSDLVAVRELDASLNMADNSYSRLAVKEQVVNARVSLLRRSL
ncbi:MAG: replication initiator protein [Microviridae sp.]|nr:MAG: replication initiator protein [Microviridae sp.]